MPTRVPATTAGIANGRSGEGRDECAGPRNQQGHGKGLHHEMRLEPLPFAVLLKDPQVHTK